MKILINKYEKIQRINRQREDLQAIHGQFDEMVMLAAEEEWKQQKEFDELQKLITNAVWNDLRTYNLSKFILKNIEGEINHENIKN